MENVEEKYGFHRIDHSGIAFGKLDVHMNTGRKEGMQVLFR